MSTDRIIDFRHAPASRWTCIGRPDDPHKSLVREDGALLYGFESFTFESWYFERVIEFGIQTDRQPLEVTQATESARVPVLVTTVRYPHATLELRAFGHQHDGERRTDVVLWSIRAHADVDEILTGLTISAYERGRHFVGRSSAPTRQVFAVAPERLPKIDRWESAMKLLVDDESQPAPGEVAFISAPGRLRLSHAAGFRPAGGLGSELALLRAGESVGGALIFPLNHQQAAGLDERWAAAALDAERAFWQGYDLQPLPIEVPDQGVMDMLVACARNIMQAREIKHGLPVFQVGPTVYRNLFVVDGHFMLECAQYLGHQADAAAGLETLLRRVKPSGAICEMEHHLKETGISIATLVRQCELLGDDDRLRRYWPAIRNAVAYIEGLRAQAYALPPDAPTYRLVPVAFADGGLGGERAEYTTPLWILFGLKSAADAARRLGLADDAARFQAGFESLLADFRAHAAKQMRELPDGTPYLPMCIAGSGDHHWIANFPGEVPPWQRIQPETGTWAFSQAIWPGEVFAPDDPLVQNLCRLYDLRDDEQGTPATSGWLPYRALWGYAASFAAHTWLYAGQPEKAIDYLYAFANHATPTRVWREEQSLSATGNGQLFGDMPHNWASAEFIRLVRHLLVFERGDTLELLPGLPAEWRAPGGAVRLERTPTRFGPVSLRAQFTEGGCRITVELADGWPIQPAQVRLHAARLGGGAVTVNGQPAAPATDGTIALPASGVVTIEFERIVNR